jgi:hypothetical protein
MHVPLHWHSANETHTMIQGSAVFVHDGREKLGPGGFNYMPAKMRHQAWTSEGFGCFDYRRWSLGRELGRKPARQS